MFIYAYDNHSLMKLQFAIVLGVILVGSIVTVNWAFQQENDLSVTAFKSSAGMVGHVTLTAIDEDGNIIAYRQTDNVIIDLADQCIGEKLFQGDWSCDDPTGFYTFVHIGSSATTLLETDTNIAVWESFTEGTVGSPSTNAGTGSNVVISATILDVNSDIREAALRNSSLSTTGGDTLALQNFGLISLGATDDLTIDWTVSIDQ